MLVLTLLEPDAALFFQQMVIPAPSLDPDAYIQAWQAVVDRHSILRTSFHWEGVEKPFQAVHKHASLPAQQIDLQGIKQHEIRGELRKILKKDRETGFDLNQAPLLRITLVHTGNNFYYVIKSHHHIILDGWSGGLILREVQAYYRGARSGQIPHMPEPQPFSDYIDWLQQKDLTGAEEFWRENLQGINVPTPLPYENTQEKPSAARVRFHSRKGAVSQELFSSLQLIAKRWRVTPSTLVHGIWSILLALYSGEKSIIFGSTFSGRPADLPGVDNIPGVFINILPVRIDLDSKLALTDWFRTVHEQILKIQEYEYSPLVQVQGWSSIPRGNPLFETLLVFNSAELYGTGQNKSRQKSSGEQVVTQDLTLKTPSSDPLILTAVAGEELSLELTADARRVNDGVLHRLLEHFNVLVQKIIDHPDGVLDDLFEAAPAERNKVVHEWNQTREEYPSNLCLHELIDRQALRSPDKIAVSSNGESLSYHELIRQSEILATHLIAAGCAPDKLVGVYMNRSVQLLVALLGILKAGGAYLPLDPAFPRDRLAYMIKDSAASIILTERSLEEFIPPHQSQVIVIDDGLSLRDDVAPEKRPVPENLVYLLYTSGTTGLPKGVMVEHRQLINFLWTMMDKPGITASDVLLAVTTLSFDISMLELFLPLLVGARVEILSKEASLDAEQLTKAIEESGATVIQATPTTWRLLLDGGWKGAPGIKVLCGGEALTSDLARQLLPQVGSLWNMYGPTETTIWSCVQPITKPTDITIGRPIANTSVYVLSKGLKPVPIGVAGALYIGGDGVVRGYMNRPELTAERFVEDPFSDIPGARMYNTGDLARWLPSGELECLGRTDHQIKIRGYRIEMGEVEAVLSEHSAVRQAAVDARPDPSGGLRLIGYIVPDTEDVPTVESVRSFMAVSLPDYMIPALFVIVQELPLTANLKVDRKALPDPDRNLLQTDSEFIPPQSETEKIIAEEWTNILQVENVGLNDNFFELGGHSLLATRVISRLKATLEISVPIPVLFEHPTVGQLAKWIESRGEAIGEEASPIVVLPRNPDGSRVAPQSFAQQRLWFLSEMAAGSALYNLAGMVPFGHVNPDTLNQALTELVRRQESLRTTFASEGGKPVQIIAAPGPVSFETVDLRQLKPSQLRVELKRLYHKEQLEPFDLARGPVARFKLIILDDNRQVLLYCMHHIITDAWSTEIFKRELRILYDAFSRNNSSPLPEPAIQYADFAAWQNERLQGEELNKQIEYWREQLAGVPHLELPLDAPRPVAPSYRSSQIPLHIQKSLTDRLEKLARNEDSTLFMVLLAAFQFVLGKHSGQDDVTVGTPIANRTHVELEEIIGFFVNNLVMRADLSGKPSFRELLARVRRTCLEAYSNQDLPFDRLVEEIAPQREPNIQPLFQVLFVLQNVPTGTSDSQMGKGLPAPADGDEGMMFYDLTLSLVESEGSLTGKLHYSTDILNRETVESLARHFRTLLENIVSSPDTPLSTQAIISEAERALIMEHSLSDEPTEAGYCIHELFEKTVDRNPQQVAVVYQEKPLSYDQLDRKANQLAHNLIARGVVPGTAVGLLLDSGINWLIGLLATLKAGGVYIPLNPEHPQDRLDWMLEDTDLKVILTKEIFSSKVHNQQVATIVLDQVESELILESESRPQVNIKPHDLAYIIYTSGSTGRPKGVMVEHRSLCHTITRQIPLFGVTPSSRLLATIAPSFDASLGEVFRCLVAGGTLYLAPREELMPGPDLIRLLKSNMITITSLVPSVLAALPLDEQLPELKTLTVGGEALSTEVARRWSTGRRLLNGYGPTETTIGATLATDWPLDAPPPIGYPLPGVHAYVLGPDMELLPYGLSGELFLGGPGVARGYLNREDLTKTSFFSDPFSPEPGARMYRTGDRVCWLPDGQLRFLGRIDEQVKIRGHRIEPSEISSMLEQYPGIKEAVVVPQEDPTGSQRLVAYYVEKQEVDTEVSEDMQSVSVVLGEWQRTSEIAATRLQKAGVDDLLRTPVDYDVRSGFQELSPQEVGEYFDITVNRIRARKPKDVLEIGSGSGQVLLRLAQHCTSYTGLDFAAPWLEIVKANLHLLADSRCEVQLLHRRADEIDQLPPDSVDTVVINSVAQYFPTVHYFLEVLEKAIPLVKKGGTLYLGGLRNALLLDTFHASTQFTSASATLSCSRLWHRVQRHATLERELFLSPQLFVRLLKEWSRVTDVQVIPTYHTLQYELASYTYDVIIVLDTQPSVAHDDCQWIDWSWDSQEEGLQKIQELLATGTGRIGVRSVPNARTCGHARLVELLQKSSESAPEDEFGNLTVADLRQALAVEPPGVDPKTAILLARDLGYRCELSWLSTGRDGKFDALFIPADDHGAWTFPAPPIHLTDWDDLANDPSRGAFARNRVTALRDYLGSQLPSYMVPAAFLQLDAMPLTVNGKLDRRALPHPELSSREGSDTEYVPPINELEEVLVEIWTGLLKVKQIGTHDNFFDLGGHSLLATQVVAAVRSRLDIVLPVTTIFSSPTIAKLAEWMKEHSLQAVDNAPPLVSSGLDPAAGREAPQSLSQQRLWFVSLLNPGSALYNSLGNVPLSGNLDLDALESALTELTRRHQSLRTTFMTRNDEHLQVIAPLERIQCRVEDLRDVRGDQVRRYVQKIRQAESAKPFDLVNGPTVRYILLHLTENRQVLLVSLHHIIADGWSMAVLRREIHVLYDAYRNDIPSPLPEPTLQYADYATWQRSWLKDKVLEEQLAFWRRTLEGAAHLDLPLDKPRPAIPRYREGLVNLMIPAPTVRQLGRMVYEEEATMFMLLLAAFQFVLGQNAGQSDVVVGTPIANRSRAELDNIIGFFTNNLVLRTDLSGNLSFRDLLRRVRQVCLEAYNHQDVPFDRLVEELAPRRELNIQPLFQVLFVLEIAPEGSDATLQTSQNTQAVSATDGGSGSMHYDLTLNLAEIGGGLRGAIHYSTDLFNQDTAERLARHFVTLLHYAVSAPEQPLSSHALISEFERQSLLERALAGGKIEADHCIHKLFEKTAEQVPDNIALSFQGNRLTYRELDQKANQLAHCLLSAADCRAKTIGLCVDRGIEWIAGALAILKAGGIYTPLNPDLPEERLGWMINNSSPVLILTKKQFSDQIPAGQPATLLIDELDGLDEFPTSPPEVEVAPGDLAYIIYTSGSTGQPKGVMVEHHSLCHTILAQISLFGITAESRVLSTIAPSFDASLGEIFRTLLSKATLFLASSEQLLPGPGLISLLKDNRITNTQLVPTVLAALPFGEPLPELKVLTVGGEAISSELAKRWGKGRKLLNGYGPTETTIGATLASNWPLNEKPPLGFPLPGVQAYVLGEKMELLPDGVPGELYLGGPGLARGYLNDPELTSKSFVKNPFSEKSQSRLYRTGDKVRWRHDGQLDYLGRLDEQVKIRGFRIELGEIRAQLDRHQGVKEAAVIAHKLPQGDQQLVAYIVAEQPAEGNSDEQLSSLVPELRTYLSRRLPNYMIPAAFVLLDGLPRTVNGKLDHKALPLPSEDDIAGNYVEYVEPTNETERILAGIWAELLRAKRIGINDNFFDLGGDSILSIRVIARAAEAGITFTVMQMYQNQTIKELALVADHGSDGTERVASEQGVVTGEIPLTPIQYWFFEKEYNPEPHHFNWATYLPAPIGITEEHLAAVMEALITHHDALRLRVTRKSNGEITQRIVDLGDQVPLSIVDLSNLPAQEQKKEMESKAEEYQTSLSLENGPILRLVLFKRTGQPGMLLLIVNHLVNDAVSWQIIREDIMSLMQQALQGRPFALPPKTASFKQWSESLRDYVHSYMPSEERDYWLSKKRWSGKFASLRLDYPNGDNTRAMAQSVTLQLDTPETRKLLKIARSERLGPDQLLLASLAIMLGRLTGCWRSLINVERHGREDLGAGINVARTVGWFPNIAPVSIELQKQSPLQDQLHQALEQLQAIPKNGIGYGLLKYCADAETKKIFEDAPEAEVFFNYFGQVGGKTRGNQKRMPDLPSTGTTVSLKSIRREIIQINSMIMQNKLQLTWAYSSGLHDRDTVKQMTAMYQQVLERLILELG